MADFFEKNIERIDFKFLTKIKIFEQDFSVLYGHES